MPELGAGASDGVWWESQPWANLSNSTDNFLLNSNSDNSAGGGDVGEDKLGKKEKEMAERDEVQVQAVVEPVANPGKKILDKKRGGRVGGSSSVKHKGKATKGKGKESSDEVVKEGSGGGDSEDDHDHELHIYTERERRKKMRNMFSSLHALLPQLPSKADKSTIVDEAIRSIKRLEITLQSLQQQKRERMRSLPNSSLVNYNHSSILMNSQKVAYDSRETFIASHSSSSNLAAASTTTTTANGFNINPDFSPLNNSLSTNSLPTEPMVFDTWTSPNVVLNMCQDAAHISVCTPKKPGVFSQICYILEKYKLVVITANINSDSHRSMYMIQAKASSAPDNQLLQMFPAQEIFKQAVTEMNLCVASNY